MQITGPFASSRKNKNPGPGSYPNKTTLADNSFSLRGKNYSQDVEKMRIPGPGSCKFQYNFRSCYIYYE